MDNNKTDYKKNNKVENEFKQFGLLKETLDTLNLLGYKKLTPIQKQVIPIIKAGDNVVGKSQTGSGKTAAFGVPICDSVKWEDNAPQALILEPTRELAAQVQDELFQIGRKRRLKVQVVFGGMPIDKEIISLKQKSHIVVGTPGRVMDHVRRQTLELANIKYLVIDEADLMLDMGFLDEVGEIINQVKGQSEDLIMALFSATLGENVDELIEENMQDAKRVLIESETQTATNISQFGYEIENDDKFNLLMKLLRRENPEECIIFCETREMVNTLFQKLRRKKIRCGMLHGGMEQRDRLYSIGDFRQGKFHVFITTDVAARGIDFPDISHVINYDFPTKRENYIHRIGRTARNGKSGIAISFIQSEEMYVKAQVENFTNSTIEMMDSSQVSASNEEKTLFEKRQKEKVVLKEGKSAAFKDTIMKLTIGGGKKSKMRAGDLVGTICSIDGVRGDDIGVIDIRDSISYVEILNGKGKKVLDELQQKTIKGKIRKVKKSQ